MPEFPQPGARITAQWHQAYLWRQYQVVVAFELRDVGEVLLGVAAQVQLGEVAVRSLADAQLHLAVGGAEDTLTAGAKTATLPERGQPRRVRHTELDVEQPVQRHHAPTLA